MNVPFDFKYHAEIQYETEFGLAFCNANGDTLNELLWDIDDRFDQYKHRLPQLSLVLKNPNDTKVDITKTVLKMLKKVAS